MRTPFELLNARGPVRLLGTAGTLALVAVYGLRVVSADSTAQTLPFSQNWTTISLITANDDWSGVSGVIGYRGDNLAAVTGTDPQTILGEGTPVVDVNANQTNPNTFATGGVTEFHITDPVIALQGSGTAQAPSLLINLNTTGQTSINVAYNLRDIDGSTDNAVQPVALHYRVGSTGSFTNVPTAFVADATTGPSLATLVTPVSVTLPAAANNQPLVQIRLMTTNAAGNDEWVGVDDISVTSGGGPVLPNLSINNVTVTEGNAGTTIASFTVSLSSPAPAGGVTFDIATADGTATVADNDYVSSSLTGQTISAGNSSYTFNVTVNGDTSVEANQTFFANVTNVTGANVADGQGQGTITNDDFALVNIHDVQGMGASSPLVGSIVSARGIVTLLKTTTNTLGALDHFFLQAPDANTDADPNTSEGILVFTSSVPTVAVGSDVTVTGTVEEFFGMTRITSVSNVTVHSFGNPLPTPVTLTTGILDPAGAPGQTHLERFEGMRVSAGSLTTVGPSDEFYDVDAVITGVTRPRREPGIEASLAAVPNDPTSGTPDCCVPRWDENPERIALDTNAAQGASLTPYTTGVVFSGVAGPLDYTFSRYRLIPETPPSATANITATALPVPTANEFTIANLNIEFFNNGATQKAKVSRAIREIMNSPDIIGHEEIASLAALQGLATQVNNDTVGGGGANPGYVAQLIPANAAGTQNVGFLVKTSRVQIDSVTQEELPGCVNTTATCYTYTHPDGTDVLNDRPPLVLRATIDPSGAAQQVIVVANHTRSFLSIDDDPTPTTGAGRRVRAKRKAQAEFLASLLQNLQTSNPGVPVISVGDYNAYEFNDGFTDPLSVIKGTPTADDQVVVDQSPDLVNPDFFNLIETVPAAERYSFVFEGTPQMLDHILVNTTANSRHVRTRIAHMNADFPDSFSTDAGKLERGSDHDAPVAYFSLTPVFTDLWLVDKFASPGTVAAGANVTYGISVANNGPNPAADATVTDVLPSGLTFVSLSAPAGWTCTTPSVGANGTISCSTGSFASGGTAGISFVAKVDPGATPGSTIDNTASVSSSATDPTPANDFDNVSINVACPAITLGALGNGIVGASYLGSAAASGGTGPYTYALTGSLPASLSLTGSGAGAGDVTGTPSAAGTYNFAITATDTSGLGVCTGSRSYTVVIGSAIAAGDLVIREFRTRGAAGATDEYVVLQSRSAQPLTIAAIDGSSGFGVADSNGNLVFTVPNGTTIPGRGFFLGVNNAGFSLGTTHDASWSADVPDGAGLGLFRSGTTFTAPNAIDAVGFAGGSTPFIEGTGLASLAAANGQYAWVRLNDGLVTKDTGANSSDFVLVSTNGGTYNGVTSILGAPSPTNMSLKDLSTGFTSMLIEPTKAMNINPNRLRVTTGGDRLEFRRRIVNNTGTTVSALRLRFVDLTTLNAPGYSLGGAQSDLRPGTSNTTAIAVTSIGATSVTGLTLLTPPNQPMGGGWNTILLLPSAPLAPGASIDINIALYISQIGSFRFLTTIEGQ